MHASKKKCSIGMFSIKILKESRVHFGCQTNVIKYNTHIQTVAHILKHTRTHTYTYTHTHTDTLTDSLYFVSL